MKKKQFVNIWVIMLATGIILLKINEEEMDRHQCFSVVQAGNEIISVYQNGIDFTERYKVLEQQAKEETVKYLNKDISDVKFINYTMLEMLGGTIEATVGDAYYTFLFDMDGRVLKVNCSEENKRKW